MAIDEKDIESVAQPDASAAYLGKDPQIGDAFVRTSLDSYQVEDAANERLAKETLDLRDENEKLKVELGNLSKVVNPEDGKGKKTDKGGFSTFISSVGDALTSFTEGIDKKMETVYDDREKRTRFLQGLNTIEKRIFRIRSNRNKKKIFRCRTNKSSSFSFKSNERWTT